MLGTKLWTSARAAGIPKHWAVFLISIYFYSWRQPIKQRWNQLCYERNLSTFNCILLMANGIEHLLNYLLAVCISSFENSVQVLSPFLMGCLFLCLVFGVPVYYSHFRCTHPIYRLSAHPLKVSFAIQSFLISWDSVCWPLAWFPEEMESYSETLHICLYFEVYSLFPSNDFKVPGRTLRSVIHLKWIFMKGER